jgi:uncharacterized membrane protein
MAGTRSGRRGGSSRDARGGPRPAGRSAPAGPAGEGVPPEVGPPAGSRAAASRAAASQPDGAPAAWIQYTTLALALAGLGMSIYLTVEHFLAGSSLACPETGVINCAKVTSSPESVVLGIPLPILGLAFFAWMSVINSPPAWRSPRPELRLVRLLSAIAGIGFVIYLVYAELFLVGNICLECTSIHVLTFALFVIIMFTATGSGRTAPRRR